MPYIIPEHREEVKTRKPETAGELNYLISRMLDDYLGDEGLNYATINEIVGVLECAKMEFYRRVATAYEEIKIVENGDVYTKSNDMLLKLYESYLGELREKK